MECAENILMGKAQALDVPIDAMKEFVELFNSRIPSQIPDSQVTVDINDLERVGQNLSLKWSGLGKSGEFTYEFFEKTFKNHVN